MHVDRLEAVCWWFRGDLNVDFFLARDERKIILYSFQHFRAPTYVHTCADEYCLVQTAIACNKHEIFSTSMIVCLSMQSRIPLHFCSCKKCRCVTGSELEPSGLCYLFEYRVDGASLWLHSISCLLLATSQSRRSRLYARVINHRCDSLCA